MFFDKNIYANTQSVMYAISLMENVQRKKLIWFKFNAKNLTLTKFQGKKVYFSHNLLMIIIVIIITLRLWFSDQIFFGVVILLMKR